MAKERVSIVEEYKHLLADVDEFMTQYKNLIELEGENYEQKNINRTHHYHHRRNLVRAAATTETADRFRRTV